MRSACRIPILALTSFAASSFAHAQTIVPPGANLQTFVTAAQPGDVLQLTPGATYVGAINVDRELTIVGPALITSTGAATTTTVNLPPTQYARFVSVAFVDQSIVVDNSSATLELCIVTGAATGPAVHARSGAELVVDSCDLNGALTQPALLAETSDVQVVSSFVRGGNAFFNKIQSIAAAPGARIDASRVTISSTEVSGGAAVNIPFGGASIPGPGLESVASEVWISDSIATGGLGLFSGASALSGSTFFYARTALQPSGQAAPTSGQATLEPELLGARESVVAASLGSIWTATFTASQANVPITFFLTQRPDAVLDLDAFVVQPFWSSGADLLLLTAGTTDVNGELVLQLPVPNAPVLQYRDFAVLGLGGSSGNFPLQATPVVGGVIL
jgi:hypothetical protein